MTSYAWISLPLFVLALLIASCGSDGRSGAEPEPADVPTPTVVSAGATSTPGVVALEVSLSEFAIEVAPASVPAGPADFDVTNDGDVAHEFLVIRSELAVDGLPLTDSGFEVDLASLDVLARYEAGGDTLMRRAQTATVSTELPAGRYVLICNVPGHYESGMAASLAVQ